MCDATLKPHTTLITTTFPGKSWTIPLPPWAYPPPPTPTTRGDVAYGNCFLYLHSVLRVNYILSRAERKKRSIGESTKWWVLKGEFYFFTYATKRTDKESKKKICLLVTKKNILLRSEFRIKIEVHCINQIVLNVPRKKKVREFPVPRRDVTTERHNWIMMS